MPCEDRSELSPLLPLPDNDEEAINAHHDDFFADLDADHAHDHVQDHPPTPTVRRVKSHLISATSQPGLGHPAHHSMQSPALILRMRQSLELGFASVWRPVLRLVHAPKLRAAAPTSASESPSAAARPRRAPRRQTLVRAVLVIAVLTMVAMSATSVTTLLFMNHSNFTSSTHIGPYVTAAALTTAVPVVSNILFTELASYVGPGRVLALGASTAALGLLLIIVVRQSLPIFYIAYALYAASNSLRVVRVSLLSKIVPPAQRTSVLAAHALMVPLGALIGPCVWITAQTFRQSFMLFGFIRIDRFSIDYFVGALAFVAIAIISSTVLRRIVSDDDDDADDAHHHDTAAQSGADAHGYHFHSSVIHFADGHDQVVDLNEYRKRIFIFFCLIMLGVNLSSGIYMTAFQPIIVNVFGVSDAKLGAVFLLIAIFAIIPPLLVAVLSRFLLDRQIIVIGLTSKLIGMLLFLPIFGPVQEWQVVVGFLLIIKASIFFSTASMSLFTKLLGPMSTSSLLGFLASGSSIGPALTQIFLSQRIVTWFGSFSFAVFAVPAILSLVAIVWPRNWQRLDANREFTKLITDEAELQQKEQS